MKKIGFIVFAAAIILGVVVSSFFSFGQAAKPFFSFLFGNKVKGSGNIATEKRDISEFTGIDVSGVFQVEVITQKEFGVEITADDNLLPLIRTEVRRGVLHIETDGRISTRNGLKVYVTLPDLDKIDASGASRINVTELKNHAIRVDSSGASKISLAGETEDLHVDVSGASSIDADGLKAEAARINASGASRVSVHALNDLNIKASGASKISYSGKPTNVEKRSSGASSITEQ